MKKLKILHVAEALDKGGLEEVIYNLVKNTGDSTFEASAAAFRGGVVAERLVQNGYSYYELPAATKEARIEQLMALIRRERFDIVQVHFCFEAIAAAKKCGVKVIETVHNTYEFFVNPWGKLKYSYYLNKADCIVPVSDAVKDFTMKHFYVLDKGKYQTIRNSIDSGRIQPADRPAADMKRELGIPEDALVVSTLSRLDVQKGLEYFIDAAKEISKTMPNVAFVIPGEGAPEYAAQLKERAADMKNVYFLGHFTRIQELFGMMDVFVMSSLWEGAPLTLLEAMAYEKAIVVTRVGNTAEVIENDRNGFLIPAKDTDILAARIRELLGDEEKRARFAKQAQQDFNEKFSNAVMIGQYKALYQSLLGEEK